MNHRPSHLLSLLGAATLFAVSPCYAILGLFDDEKKIPTAEELSEQESLAMESFAKAKTLQNEGKGSKARGIFEDIVHDYPLTDSAAASQYEIGAIYDDENEVDRAFEAYQEFIDNYKGSDLFGEAVKRQFEIATKAMNSKTTRVLGVIPSKAAKSRVIEMFTQVAANAPYSKYAPLALYQVGVLLREGGQDAEAIVAFQEMADRYSDDPKSKEAQLAIIQIRGNRWTRDAKQDRLLLTEGEIFVEKNEDDPRAEEVRAKIGQLEEKEAEKTFNIGRYYERKGNLRSAALYYQDVKASPGEFFKAAQARLEALKSQDPNLLQAPSAPKHKVVAPVNVVDREDYYGPKPPKLEAAPKPKMRVSEVDIQPIPPKSASGDQGS